MSDVITPKLKVPFEIEGDHAAVVEQDSDEEVTQCVLALLRTRPGTRPDDAQMGIPDFAFRQDGADLDLIRSVITKYEPRAAILADQELLDLVDSVNIEVEALTTENING